MWPIYMFWFHAALVMVMQICTVGMMTLFPFDVKNGYCLVLTVKSFFVLSMICLIFAYKNREQKRKFWRAVSQADDFMTRFLRILLCHGGPCYNR